MKMQTIEALNRIARITAGNVELEGELKAPEAAAGIVVFAHGSGSSRHSPRNQFVAHTLRAAGLEALLHVTAPTLLIVGGLDTQVIALNRLAYAQMRCEKQLRIGPGASHLFEEPGTLEEVARLAAAWFQQNFQND